MSRGAILSPCGLFRYALWEDWADGPRVNWCCLNPSWADAKRNDPSFKRMVSFSKAWGFGGLIVTNLFAYRTDEPEVMKAQADPVGPDNDAHIVRAAMHADLVVAAWGADGGFQGRDVVVRRLLPRPHYLRLTKGGHPGHPLYLPGSLRPVEWAEYSHGNKNIPKVLHVNVVADHVSA